MDPVSIEEYRIYDIFHNDNGKLVIISPFIDPILKIEYLGKLFNCNECPDKHSRIYFLEAVYNETIELKINGINIKTRVNKYPDFRNEIVFSTLVKNEDAYILQWIDYYIKIGINRFIIYDNSSSSTLAETLKPCIEDGIVVLIKWLYPYHLKAQHTQQNHSIYAFQNSKYIGLFDVDEYINIQNKKINNLNAFLNYIEKSHNINLDKISGFMLLNKFFYNPFRLPSEGEEFFKIFNCDEVSEEGFEKCIVIPKNVKTFSVHVVTDGGGLILLDKSHVYFNHYYFLNKNDRGFDLTPFTDNSILSLT
jgi:hypothetical protein